VAGDAGSSEERVTAVVVTWRGRRWLGACLDALAAAFDGPTIVIDNASDDGTADLLAARPGVCVVRMDQNQGFAGGVSEALRRVRTPFVLLVNDDAEVQSGFVDALLAPFDRADGTALGACTAKLLLPDGHVNNAGGALLRDGYGYDRGLSDPDDGRWDTEEDVELFSGGGALLRMDAVRDVGGFPAPFFLYYEDADTSVRMRAAGWRIRYVPAARAVHLHAASSDPTSARFHFYNERNRLLMLVRCFPTEDWRRELWRFARSIGGFARRRVRGQRPAQPSEQVLLRLRVLLSVLRLLPWALRARRWRSSARGPQSVAAS
jgi:GT2 family glycosyltransferase